MVTINDKTYPLNNTQSLTNLLNSLNIDAEKGVAIAVNNVVVPKSGWVEFQINKHDKIILIKATQGG